MSRKVSRDFVKIPTPKEFRKTKVVSDTTSINLDKILDLTDPAQRMEWIKRHRPSALKTRHKIIGNFN